MHFFVSGKGKESSMIFSAEKLNKNLVNYLFHARNPSTRIFKSSHSESFHYTPAVESKGTKGNELLMEDCCVFKKWCKSALF